ncbi:MAG: hypothetical protein A3D64_01460 [Candidatus Wildermuthbacteria bacterium RIFCSPHIGHO2_02_FULL_49_9]|nr:MAG: hypothetical protein A3D64_01460 [Candidatus Wildermuthbacteria bacterium RIFCSPHIGHO2_02_FULL_49_9]
MIILTGHKGLIGLKLYEELSRQHEMFGIDEQTGGRCEDMSSLVELPEPPEMIIHSAAHCFIKRVTADPSQALQNILMTFSALEFCRTSECKKFVYFSSSRIEHKELHNPYIASKRASEELVMTYAECYGIEYVIIRPETIWGYSYDNDRVMIKWIEAAKKNEDIYVYGSPEKELSPLHVDTFTPIATDIMENFDSHKGRIYTVSGKVRKVQDIIDIIKQETGSGSNVVYKEPEPTQPQVCLAPNIEGEDDLRMKVREAANS